MARKVGWLVLLEGLALAASVRQAIPIAMCEANPCSIVERDLIEEPSRRAAFPVLDSQRRSALIKSAAAR